MARIELKTERMPPGGTKELLKSESGRKYLNELRSRFKNDLHQPGSPEFEKHYRPKIEEQQRRNEEARRKSQDLWAERRNRQAWAKKHQ